MFSVKKLHHNQLGEIRTSWASPNSNFQNKTPGIALKYVYQGQEAYNIQNTQIKIAHKSFLLLRPDQIFKVKTGESKNETKGICIDFNISQFQNSNLLENELIFGHEFSSLCFEDITQKLDQLVFSQNNRLEKNALLINITCLAKALSSFAYSIETIQGPLQKVAKKITTQKELLRKLLRAKNYVHLHYKNQIKIDTLARQSGISPFYLSRLFQSCFRQTPLQLQMELRMQKAIQLIKQNRCSLSEMALELGFHDLSAFSNQFKKYHQIPPSVFKRNLIK